LPLLVVATALEEISTKVGHIGFHLFEERKGSGGAITEVHGPLVHMGEHHLLVEVVYAAWIVADVGGDGVVFRCDELNVCCFVGFGVQNRLKDGVGNLLEVHLQ